MRKLMNVVSMACLATTVMLSGCVSNETRQDQAAPAQPTIPPPAQPAESKMTTVVVEGKTVIVEAPKTNPVTIKFDKMTIKPDEEGKRQIAQFVRYAKTVSKIELTGYCDKHQVANAGDAAVMRAVFVRDELIQLGVDKNNIFIKSKTTVPKKHAVDIYFQN